MGEPGGSTVLKTLKLTSSPLTPSSWPPFPDSTDRQLAPTEPPKPERAKILSCRLPNTNKTCGCHQRFLGGCHKNDFFKVAIKGFLLGCQQRFLFMQLLQISSEIKNRNFLKCLA